MEPDVEAEIEQEMRFCPECGAEESGYFCRSCGALLRDDDRVLCPRCRQVVPAGGFCNQCGQGLGGVALSLRQLALAGDTFWVTSEAPVPESSLEPSLFSSNASIELAPAELPDWLHELPLDSDLKEGQPHIYPSLEPIDREGKASRQGQFVMVAVLLMGLLMVGMMIMVIVFLLRGGA